jgi:parallel beta-helix repeat protein
MDSFGLLRRPALLGALACLTAVGVAIPTTAAAEVTSLTSCQDIISPGHYRLDANINTDAGTCFLIDASDVRLDLNRHTITGPGPRRAAFGIAVAGSGVGIVGPGRLSGGWDPAIGLEGEHGSVRDVAATGNQTGISLAPHSERNSLRGNVILNNNDFGIIAFAGATDNRITGNFALNNGIDLDDGNPNCDSNEWKGNSFRTAVPSSCIH